MTDVTPDSAETCALLQRITEGDDRALDALLQRHRPQVQSFVCLHLDPRLRARIDPSDVVQDVQLESIQRMAGFLERRPMPFHLWLRWSAYQRLRNLHRHHLRRQELPCRRERGSP